MRAHIIENGIVTNTIEVESLGFMPSLIDAEDGGSIGDLWNGTAFTKPEIEVVIPKTITMRQARLALLTHELLSQVEGAITAAEHKIWWEYSTVVERNHLLVCSVLDNLGKSADEIDALFVEAAGL